MRAAADLVRLPQRDAAGHRHGDHRGVRSASAGSGATSSTGSSQQDYPQMAQRRDARRRARPGDGRHPLDRPADCSLPGTHREVQEHRDNPAGCHHYGPRRCLGSRLSHRPCRRPERSTRMKRTILMTGAAAVAALALAACGANSNPTAPAGGGGGSTASAAGGSHHRGFGRLLRVPGPRRDLRRRHQGQGHHGHDQAQHRQPRRLHQGAPGRLHRHRPGVHRLPVDLPQGHRPVAGPRRGVHRAQVDLAAHPRRPRQVDRRGQELHRRHQGHRRASSR